MRIPHFLVLLEKAFLSGNQKNIRWVLTGQPGIGKSAMFQRFKEMMLEKHGMEIDLVDWRTMSMDRTEVKGIAMPNKEDKTMDFYRVSLLPKKSTKKIGIVILEEVTSSPASIQTALLQFIWDRKIYDYVLPDGYAICGTGNRVEDGCFVERMSKAMGGRVVHWTLDIHIDDVIKHFYKIGVHPIITAFIKKCPELLNNFDAKSKAMAFATPRTYDILHQNLQFLAPTMEEIKHCLNNHIERQILMELTLGTLGEGAGHTMFQFMEVCGRMINPRTILDDPENAPFPKDISEMFAIHGALVNMAEFTNIDHILKYYKRLPEHMADFIDKFIIDTRIRLCGADINLRTIYSESVVYFRTWANKNMEIIMGGA